MHSSSSVHENDAPTASEIVRVNGILIRASLTNGEVCYSELGSSDKAVLQSVPPDFVEAIRFPCAVRKPSSTGDLIRATEALLQSFADFGGLGARCLALSVLSTWFADCLPALPNVVLVSSAPSTGAAVFRVCEALTRRPITATADSALIFSGWAAKLDATLLVDATAASNRALRWAAGVNAKGVMKYQLGRVSGSGNPRVFLASDALPIGDSLQIALLSGRTAPVPPDARLSEIAHEYGAMFVGYRLQHLSKYRNDETGLVADPDQLSLLEHTISSCIFDDDLLKANVGPIFRRHSGIRANFDGRDDVYILAAVLVTFAHDGRKKVSVEEITDRVADFTALRGDTDAGGRISIGRMLSKIGVSRIHTNKRNEVVLDPPNINAVHQAAWLKSALHTKNLAADCVYCQWLTGKDGLGTEDGEDSEGSEQKTTEAN